MKRKELVDTFEHGVGLGTTTAATSVVVFRTKENKTMHLHGLLIRRRKTDKCIYEFRWKYRRTVIFKAKVEVVEAANEIYIHKMCNMHRLNRTDHDNASADSKMLARRIAPKTVAVVIAALQAQHAWIDCDTSVALAACGKTFVSRSNVLRLISYYRGMGLKPSYGGRHRWSQRYLAQLMKFCLANGEGVCMEGTVGSVLSQCPRRWSDRCYRIESIV